MRTIPKPIMETEPEVPHYQFKTTVMLSVLKYHGLLFCIGPDTIFFGFCIFLNLLHLLLLAYFLLHTKEEETVKFPET